MNDAQVLILLLNFLVIIVAVVLKPRLSGKKWKIMMATIAITIVISGIVYRLSQGGF